MRYTLSGTVLGYKKNEVLPFATTWMNLSEISQRQILLYIINESCEESKS